MKMKKIFIIVIVIFVILVTTMPVLNIVSANGTPDSGKKEFWKNAGTWFNNVQQKSTDNVSPISIDVVNEFMDMVNYIGTVIIIIATMFLVKLAVL